MKPADLIKSKYPNGYADSRLLLKKYVDIDCVVAYKKCFMGITFIIKGKKDFFGLQFINETCNENNVNKIHRFSLVKIKKIFMLGDENDVIIVDKELFDLFERTVLYQAINQ